MTENLLPTGFSLRHTRWDDLEAVAQLILEVCTADGDASVAAPPAELKTWWKTPGFNLETDTWVVTNPAGKIIGYEEFVDHHAHASLMGDGYVHHDFTNLGIGTLLLRTLEDRARAEMALAEPDLRVFIRNFMSIGDTTARQLHQNEGYKPIRFSWRMEIQLSAPPPAPVFPEGVELRAFDPTRDLFAVYEAVSEAFADHWGYVKSPFNEWKHKFLAEERYLPDLWHIAWDGDQIAGVSICRYRNGIGWVGSLGVRRPWRKKGLGMALLQHSFGEFHRRGYTTIGLGVDASNPTGATRLYERAGMKIASEYVMYEKELRPGREPEE
jgi:mycothiol synthase